MALHGIVGFDVKWGSRCWAEAVQFLVDLCLVIVCFFLIQSSVCSAAFFRISFFVLTAGS